MECGYVFKSSINTDHCDRCRPHMIEAKGGKMKKLKKLTKLQQEIISENRYLGFSQGSWTRINNTNINHVESSVTDSETNEVLGFCMAEGEKLEKERKFKISLAYAQATVNKNPGLIKRFGLDVDGTALKDITLNKSVLKKGDKHPKFNEILMMAVEQLEDFKESDGYNFEIPQVKISFQYYNKKFKNWCAMTKGSYGFKFRGHSNYKLNVWKANEIKSVTTCKETGKQTINGPKQTNAHIIYRDMEDIFVMREGYPVALKNATKRVEVVIDGEKVLVDQELSVDVITAYVARLGYRLDGVKYRAVIDCPALGLMVGSAIGDEKEYADMETGMTAFEEVMDKEISALDDHYIPAIKNAETSADKSRLYFEYHEVMNATIKRVNDNAGSYHLKSKIVAVRPKAEPGRDIVLSKKESSELMYRPVSDDSYVSSGMAAWNDKKNADAEAKKANKYASRVATGKEAMKIRLDNHAAKVLKDNPKAKAVFDLLLQVDELEALDMTTTLEDPKSVMKVAKAMKRLHGKELPYDVYRGLRASKKDALDVRTHELIDLLNGEDTYMEALRRMEGDINLIEDVLEVANSNLALYKSHKKRYANTDIKDYKLIEYRAFKLLKDLHTKFGNVA